MLHEDVENEMDAVVLSVSLPTLIVLTLELFRLGRLLIICIHQYPTKDLQNNRH